jgi:hypothetical protein
MDSIVVVVVLAAAPSTDLTSLRGGTLFQTLLPGLICFAWPFAFLFLGVLARFAVGGRSRTVGGFVGDVLLCTGVAGTAWLATSLFSGVFWLQIIDDVLQRVAVSFAAGVCGAAVIRVLIRRPITGE